MFAVGKLTKIFALKPDCEDYTCVVKVQTKPHYGSRVNRTRSGASVEVPCWSILVADETGTISVSTTKPTRIPEWVAEGDAIVVCNANVRRVGDLQYIDIDHRIAAIRRLEECTLPAEVAKKSAPLRVPPTVNSKSFAIIPRPPVSAYFLRVQKREHGAKLWLMIKALSKKFDVNFEKTALSECSKTFLALNSAKRSRLLVSEDELRMWLDRQGIIRGKKQVKAEVTKEESLDALTRDGTTHGMSTLNNKEWKGDEWERRHRIHGSRNSRKGVPHHVSRVRGNWNEKKASRRHAAAGAIGRRVAAARECRGPADFALMPPEN